VAGIYFHVPFCRKACHYCDFHFSTSLKLREPMLRAMRCETELAIPKMNSSEIKTIYFGGGTPGILEPAEIGSMIDKVRSLKGVSPHAEITLEANPDDVTAEKVKAWKGVGVNRLSIGIQSFRDEDLKLMNRSHDAKSAENCVLTAQQAGLDNITIDLIYGLPHLDEKAWIGNIDKALALKIPHFSAYCLTVEPRTALASMVKKGTVPDVNEEMAAAHYDLMVEKLGKAGYRHYEVSNFALPGFESKHNSAYWSGEKYEGIGPSAHSFDGKVRSWNVANNSLYIKEINSGNPQRASEELTPDQQFNEFVLLGLRTAKGIDLSRALLQFGRDIPRDHAPQISTWMENGLMEKTANGIRLTEKGFFQADGIAAALFV